MSRSKIKKKPTRALKKKAAVPKEYPDGSLILEMKFVIPREARQAIGQKGDIANVSQVAKFLRESANLAMGHAVAAEIKRKEAEQSVQS